MRRFCAWRRSAPAFLLIGVGFHCVVAAAQAPRSTRPPAVASRSIQEHIDATLATMTGAVPDPSGSRRTAHPNRVLVRFKQHASAAARQGIHQVAGTRRVLRELRSVAGLAVVQVREGGVAQAIAAYRADQSVRYAEPDYPIEIADVPNDPEFERLWGMQNTRQAVSGFFCFPTGTQGADIRAADAWDVWTGDPEFRIAIIDTGINYLHPDLAPNVWTNPGEVPDNGIDDDGNGWIDDVHGYDFYNQDPDPLDDHRHGSHVAGTIGAAGNNELGVAGVNHQCSLVGLKIFDANGRGFISDAVLAMEYVIQNGIRVSNNSWGCSDENSECFSQALHDVIEASRQIGHVFVAAAGNDFGNNNDEIPYYPASYEIPNIISVAAIDNRGRLALFSNLGVASVDLAAPGTCIYSTMLGSAYGYLDGTSMATPHVAGVLALVMSRLPELTWQQARTRVVDGARPVSFLTGVVKTGGVVNAASAVWDCNNNGIPDERDVSDGLSEDCNANAFPDECEPDCNQNGVADGCDIASGISADCGLNDIPDECEPDCNRNGIEDSCDIRDGVSGDCDDNGNGIPDECEADCNNNGIADTCDIERDGPDCNRNGLLDVCEPGGQEDCNGDNVIDLCAIFVGRSSDCNASAVPDDCDIASGFSEDCTGNGRPDECERDCNNNGFADSCDIADGVSLDCSGNGVPDECEKDCNENGKPDVCDIADQLSNDCNNNRIPDECEPGGTLATDCNTNGVPDLCDLHEGVARDCNSNTRLDNCDLADGTSVDVNGDGIPDECEGKGFLLVPISATGSHTINGHHIALDKGGQTITFELRLSGWDLETDGTPLIRGYQAQIDASGFTGGLFGSLRLARTECSTDEDCPGFNTECLEDGLCTEAAAVFVDDSRSDFVFANLLSVRLVNVITYAPDFRIISALFRSDDSVPDPGVEQYAATILLDVSPVAGGTFEIGFVEDQSILAASDQASIVIPSFTSAVVTIPSDCNNNGVLDPEDVANGTSADCNGNGVPDECIEVEPDCTGNGIPDDCDIAAGRSEDCTANGVPDECEPDCDGNGFADSCDLAAGLSLDINANGIPDVCDLRRTIHVDSEECFFPGTGAIDDPYCNLRFAVDSAGENSDAIVEIIIQDGVYRGLVNRDIDLEIRALTIRSANGPANCIIDLAESGRAFKFNGGGDYVSLDGFTIINGSADLGGAIFCRSSNPTISNCVFRNNTALRSGGAIYLTRSHPTIRNCVFTNNVGEFFNGGAIYCSRSNPEISNCVITGNRANQGGGLYTSLSGPTVRNSTIAYNTADSIGGAFYSTGSSGTTYVTNNIIWGNNAPLGPEVYLSGSARWSVGYNDVAGGIDGVVVVPGGTLTWLDGNFDGDPRFVDVSTDDYHLSSFSPCINSGDPDFVPSEGESDLDGGERVLLGTVDVGADEATTFSDCNGNTVPDGTEVLDGLGADCNGNAQLDACDLTEGTSSDTLPPEGDGIPDDCQTDCNENAIPDVEDIASGASLDENEDGVPDECGERCASNLDCADDDPCTFDRCDGTLCSVQKARYGDVGGVDGVCGPDERVDVFDITAVLNGFEGVFADGCGLANLDIAGVAGSCVPNDSLDLFDILAVLNAFEGSDGCCATEP